MLSRTTRREKPVRRSRHRGTASAEHPAADSPRAQLAVAERSDFDRNQDTATYSCGCGMVFDASVSTSVSCPHCGSSQAW